MLRRPLARTVRAAATAATPNSRRTPPPRRPTRDDVDSIARGGPAKSKRGWGSRQVPHRLNADEAAAFAAAKAAGVARLRGSGYRSERGGAPLANTWRQWCDANAAPAILLLRKSGGEAAVVVDLSTLRLPRRDAARALAAARAALADAATGCVELQGRDAAVTLPFTVWADGPVDEGEEEIDDDDDDDAPYLSAPIWQQRPVALVYAGPLDAARALSSAAVERLRGVEKMID